MENNEIEAIEDAILYEKECERVFKEAITNWCSSFLKLYDYLNTDNSIPKEI